MSASSGALIVRWLSTTGVVEPARVSFRVSLKADGTWSSWRPTPDTGELDYPNDAREIQHWIAAAPRWAHLGLAIQLTVERNARPRRCSALSSWFTRLVRSAISLFKAIIPPRATTLPAPPRKSRAHSRSRDRWLQKQEQQKASTRQRKAGLWFPRYALAIFNSMKVPSSLASKTVRLNSVVLPITLFVDGERAIVMGGRAVLRKRLMTE